MVIVGHSSIESLAIFDPALGVFSPCVRAVLGGRSRTGPESPLVLRTERTNQQSTAKSSVKLSSSQSGLLRVEGKAWTISTAPVETERPPEWIAPHTAGR